MKNTKDKKIYIKIIKKTFTAFIWLLIIAVLCVIIRALVFKKNDVFGYRIYVLITGSMSPTIDIYDIVITKEKNNYEISDIIAFDTNEGITLHRITDKYTKNGETLYKTKGDFNNCEDIKPVNNNQIKGAMVCKISKIGRVISFIKENTTLILIDSLIIVFIIALSVFIRRLL